MAQRTSRLPENVPGPFFVDESCIDCAVCRHLAPTVFARSPRDLSFVARQPASDEERVRALMALVACPTASIGSVFLVTMKGRFVRYRVTNMVAVVNRSSGFSGRSSTRCCSS